MEVRGSTFGGSEGRRVRGCGGREFVERLKCDEEFCSVLFTASEKFASSDKSSACAGRYCMQVEVGVDGGETVDFSGKPGDETRIKGSNDLKQIQETGTAAGAKEVRAR